MPTNGRGTKFVSFDASPPGFLDNICLLSCSSGKISWWYGTATTLCAYTHTCQHTHTPILLLPIMMLSSAILIGLIAGPPIERAERERRHITQHDIVHWVHYRMENERQMFSPLTFQAHTNTHTHTVSCLEPKQKKC